jgi:glycosyltransferase involved in cell wall biosynthesis
MNGKRPFLSIIVPTYNARRELGRLLRSIEASPSSDREILVVDDGSTDGTLSMLESAPVRVLCTPKNRGPAFARNQGARAARGEVLLFLDSDVELEPDALAETARFFRDHPDRSVMIGVYSPVPANDGAWPLYKALQCYSYYSAFPAVKEVTLLWAAVAAFRRDVFLRSGGFDTRFARPSMEDLELGRRIARSTPIFLNRKVVARHNFPATIAKNVADHFDRGRLWVRIYFRHRRFDNYLSTPRRALGRIAASASVPLLAVSPALPAAAVASGAAFAVYAACNHDLWRSVLRRRPSFLPAAIAFDFLLGLVLGAAAFVACGEEVAARVLGSRREEAEEAAALAPDSPAEALLVPAVEAATAAETEEAALQVEGR